VAEKAAPDPPTDSTGEHAGDAASRLLIMTTMHYVVSGAGASTVYVAVGRSGMYLTKVSMTLVALGFISSATSMGDGFAGGLFADTIVASGRNRDANDELLALKSAREWRRFLEFTVQARVSVVIKLVSVASSGRFSAARLRG